MKQKNSRLFGKLGFFAVRNFNKFFCFCLVGFGAFLIDWFFFNAFYNAGAGFVFSKISSALISIIFNFNINRNFTFNARKHSMSHQAIKWIMVYSVSISVTVITGRLVLDYLGEGILNANIAYFIGIGAAIPFSFLGSLLWAFRKK